MKKIFLKQVIFALLFVLMLANNANKVNAIEINLPNDIIQGLDTRFVPVLLSYGDGYASKDEYDMAEQFYKEALSLQPDNLKIKYRLGLIMEMQKKLPESENIYRDIIKTNPKEMQAYYSLGLILDQQNKSLEGIEFLKKALELEPDNAYINYDIGVVYARLRDYPQSKYYSQKAVEIKPDFAESLNNLCYAQGNIGEYEDAIKNCEKSLEYKPNSAATIDSLAFVYAKTGQIDKAIEKYIEAIKFDNSIGEIFFHLAEAYEKKNDKAKALIAYRKYIELDKEAYNKAEISQKINALEKEVTPEEADKAEKSLEKDIKATPIMNLQSNTKIPNIQIFDIQNGEIQESPSDDGEIPEIKEYKVPEENHDPE